MNADNNDGKRFAPSQETQSATQISLTEKARPVHSTGTDGNTATTAKDPVKIERVFKMLLDGWKGTKFQAETQLHDHCLNTSVSIIQRRYNIKVSRKWITIPGYQGLSTHCKLYWIEPSDAVRYKQSATLKA